MAPGPPLKRVSPENSVSRDSGVEAGGARGVARGVQGDQFGAGDLEGVPVVDPRVRLGAGEHGFPEDLVGGVQVHRGAHLLGEVAGVADVVVVAVGEQDGLDGA